MWMKRIIQRIALPRPDCRKFAAYLREKYVYVTLAAFLLIGMVVGALLAQNPDHVTKNGVSSIIMGYSAERSNQPFLQTVFSSIQSVLPFYLVIFFSGVFALGALLVPLTLLFRGLGLGLITGYLYSSYGFQGFFYSLLLVLPFAFLSAFFLIVLARDSIRLSVRLAGALAPSGKGEALWPGFRIYCMRAGALFLMLCAASLLDSLFTVIFSGLFSF